MRKLFKNKIVLFLVVVVGGYFIATKTEIGKSWVEKIKGMFAKKV